MRCYGCLYRRALQGDAHSACRHPATAEAWSLDGLDGYAFMRIDGQTAIHESATSPALNIRAERQGIASGWFNWPWNFDPVWLRNCDGFIRKGGEA